MWKGTNYGVLNTTFRNPDGTFAYDKIQEMNAASPDGSRMIMSKSNNNHMWYGLLSTYTNQISKSLELSARYRRALLHRRAQQRDHRPLRR